MAAKETKDTLKKELNSVNDELGKAQLTISNQEQQIINLRGQNAALAAKISSLKLELAQLLKQRAQLTR